MITMENTLRDVERDEYANAWLVSYSSVPQINRLLKLISPFKFKTLYTLAPKGLKSSVKDLVRYFNGEDNTISQTDERSILLWENEEDIPLYDGGRKPYIVPFLLKNKKAPCVVIAPGGSYINVCMRDEGVKVAEKFNSLGFHAVIVNYRVSPSRYPCPQIDFIRAIQLVRDNAEKWGVMADKIVAMGFSAGGHLVTSINGLYDEVSVMLENSNQTDGRPNAVVAGYPMIDLKCKMLGITCDMIFLGDKYNKENSKKYSVQNLINKDYPPMFLFSMENDPVVPPKTNCLCAKRIMDNLGVKNKVIIYEGNRHGFALGEGTKAEKWVEEALAFLYGIWS